MVHFGHLAGITQLPEAVALAIEILAGAVNAQEITRAQTAGGTGVHENASTVYLGNGGHKGLALNGLLNVAHGLVEQGSDVLAVIGGEECAGGKADAGIARFVPVTVSAVTALEHQSAGMSPAP